MLREDPFGLRTKFVWFANFRKVLADPAYLNSIKVTVVFSLRPPSSRWRRAPACGQAEKVVHGKGLYRTLLIWPYAVAPAIAGMLWLFLFNPSIGSLAYMLRSFGIAWDPLLNGTHAMILLVVRRCLEADQLQFPVLRRRPAGDPESR